MGGDFNGWKPPGQGLLVESPQNDSKRFPVKNKASVARVGNGVIRGPLPAGVRVRDDQLIETARDGRCLHAGGKARLVEPAQELPTRSELAAQRGRGEAPYHRAAVGGAQGDEPADLHWAIEDDDEAPEDQAAHAVAHGVEFQASRLPSNRLEVVAQLAGVGLKPQPRRPVGEQMNLEPLGAELASEGGHCEPAHPGSVQEDDGSSRRSGRGGRPGSR